MGAGRIIAYIAAAILLFFGVLFMWAAFGQQFNLAYLIEGLVAVAIGFGIIWFTGRQAKAAQEAQNVTLKVDLGGDVNLETLKCKSCGGALSPDNVKMVAGAPVVTCPYCGTSYQLTEEPKW